MSHNIDVTVGQPATITATTSQNNLNAIVSSVQTKRAVVNAPQDIICAKGVSTGNLPTNNPNFTGIVNIDGDLYVFNNTYLEGDVTTEGSRFTPYIAGAAVGGQRAVVTDPAGKVIHADNTNDDHFGLFTGITNTSVILDEEVLVVSYGRMIDPAFSFIPEEKLYLSTNGLLTQTAPTTGFLQSIGHAISSDTIFINPQIPTRLI